MGNICKTIHGGNSNEKIVTDHIALVVYVSVTVFQESIWPSRQRQKKKKKREYRKCKGLIPYVCGGEGAIQAAAAGL